MKGFLPAKIASKTECQVGNIEPKLPARPEIGKEGIKAPCFYFCTLLIFTHISGDCKSPLQDANPHKLMTFGIFTTRGPWKINSDPQVLSIC